MAKEFLRSVAETFVSMAGKRLQHYCFVFPNRRSSLFFRKYLGESSEIPLFSPRLTTVNDLFASLSGLRTADKITLLAGLYKVFRDCIPEFDEPFDDFLYRGEVVLGDFDDIDKYLADAQSLFANISDLKEIESKYDYFTENQRKAIESFWGTLNEFRGHRKEAAFLKMWNSLYPVYLAFKDGLEKKGLAYEGMIYRDVAERLTKGDDALYGMLDKYESIVFVGLNAPNNCERVLFDALKRIGKGNFYWDFYGEAVCDPGNKSSFFMRDNISRYPSCPELPAETDPGSGRPDVEAVAVPSSTGQAKYVYGLLQELARSGADMFRTAIVLPDENLLLPLLNSIPPEVRTINVTMGYPLVNSEVYSFVSLLANLQERMTVRPDEGPLFHYRDVTGLLNHSFMKKALPEWSERTRAAIYRENIVYLPASGLRDGDLASAVFEPVTAEENADLPSLLTGYMKRALEAVSLYVGSVDKEFLFNCYKSLNLLDRIGLGIRKDTYFRLFRRILSSVSIPFAGEPLSGLQIMGPLETRALDFDNIIMLSVNEGVFPTGATAASMIPYNLRKGFGLPTYEYQDSVSAYHFYRSICRARKVWLLYDSRSGGLMSGEESRYIKQLEYIYKYDIVRKNVSFALAPALAAGEDDLFMNEEESKALSRFSFSPSSIAAYMRCGRQFYYRYVRMLKEPDNVMEDVDASAFGQIYHWVMQHVYDKGAKYGNKEMDTLVRKARHDLPEMVQAGFMEVLKIRKISGKNRIAAEMVSRLVMQTLKRDAGLPGGFAIEENEKKVKGSFTLSSGRLVGLKGVVDRIDRVEGGILRIVDYKTGGKHFEMRSVPDLFDKDRFESGSHVFQLYFYLLLLELDGRIGHADGILMEIYYTSELFSEGRNVLVADGQDYEEFKRCLSGLLEEILDPSIPFVRRNDSRICENCPFLAVCGI